MDEPRLYEICIEGHLTERWSDWLDGVTIHHSSSGVTTLTGSFVDQSALLGVLTKIHTLNLVLISVRRLPCAVNN